MHGVTAGREESVAVPSPVTAAEGAALPADDVLARLGSGTPGLPGDEAARRLGVVGPNAVRSRRVHALSVLASQLRTPADAAGGDRHGRRRPDRDHRGTGLGHDSLARSAR
ncbi:MAG: cation-transporting P-type ATPase [Streptosporangiales bacterium]